MTFRRMTPRMRMQRLHEKRLILIFSEEEQLIETVKQAAASLEVETKTLNHLSGDEAKPSRDHRVFLVHWQSRSKKPHTIVESLCSQNKQIGEKIFLITEELMDHTTKQFMQQHGLRGYIPRPLLIDLLKRRLTDIFDTETRMRQNNRIQTAFPVAFELLNMRQRGTCTSFSEAGMFIQTLKPPGKDLNIKIAFQMPDSKKTEILRSKVNYQLNMGFGVVFNQRVSDLFNRLSKLQALDF